MDPSGSPRRGDRGDRPGGAGRLGGERLRREPQAEDARRDQPHEAWPPDRVRGPIRDTMSGVFRRARRGVRTARMTRGSAAAAAVAVLVAVPAAASGAWHSLYSGRGPRPGPDLLYTPAPKAAQLTNKSPWK